MFKLKPWLLSVASLGMFLSSAVGADPPPKADASGDKAGIAAYVGSEAITLQEVDAKALKTNMKLSQQLYDARKAVLDQIVMERLLAPEATAKGTTVEKHLASRLAEMAKPITDADVQSYFDSNKARMGTKTLEQVSGQIRGFLTTQRETEVKGNLLKELKSKAQVRIVLDAPRTEVVIAANDPTKGPPDAKVTIVEISDFQ